MNKIALKIIVKLCQRSVTVARNTDIFSSYIRDCSLSVACSGFMIRGLLTDCIVPFKDYQIFGLTAIKNQTTTKPTLKQNKTKTKKTTTEQKKPERKTQNLTKTKPHSFK